MASVRAPSAIRRLPLELHHQAVPLAGIDANEMGLLALLQCRHALAGQSAKDDRLGLAVERTSAAERINHRCNFVAVDLLRLPAEGPPFLGDRLHVEDEPAV